MHFVLVGFTQEMGFRAFAFEGIAANNVRTAFVVKVDLALIARYGIRMQELPLMCRGLLEGLEEGEERTLTFTEERMRVHATDSAAAREAAAQKKKPPRKPAGENLGSAWRGPQR
jgi:hypothetical protein